MIVFLKFSFVTNFFFQFCLSIELFFHIFYLYTIAKYCQNCYRRLIISLTSSQPVIFFIFHSLVFFIFPFAIGIFFEIKQIFFSFLTLNIY